MLRAVLSNWLRPTRELELDEGRSAYQSDIRAIRPEAWFGDAPVAFGRDVEHALWLAGVTSRDFDEQIDIVLSPHRVTPVEDIVRRCTRRAEVCRREAETRRAELPPPNPYGRPPLPWHRDAAREAEALDRAAEAWETLSRLLVSNRWSR